MSGAQIAALGRQLRELVAGVHEGKRILAQAGDPKRPVFRHLHIAIARDERQIAKLMGKLDCAHAQAQGDLLMRLEIAEQIRLGRSVDLQVPL